MVCGLCLVIQRVNAQEPAAPAPAPGAKPAAEAAPAEKPAAEAAPAEKKAPTPEEVAADLKSGAGAKRIAALRSILAGEVKDKAVLQPLLDVVADDSEANKEARPLAMRALIALKDANLTPLEKDSLLQAQIEAIRDKDRDVQAAAIVGIGTADLGAEPALLSATTGDDAPIRILAFQRLALMWANQTPIPKKGPPPAPPEVLKALGDENADVRNAATVAFWAGGFKDKAAIPALLKMLEDKADNSAPGRANALHALAALRSGALTAAEQKEIVDAIQAGLKDDAPNVRYYAVWGIQRDDKALLPALDVAVTDVDPRVRALAHEKLFQVRAFETPAAGALGKAPAQIISGLADVDPGVRAEAVRTFWFRGYKDAAAIAPLLAILDNKTDENRVARLDAIRALANLRAAAISDEDKGRIKAVIISSLKDPDFVLRYQAAKAITAADAEALPALQEAQNDENPMVQTAVKAALQRLGKK